MSKPSDSAGVCLYGSAGHFSKGSSLPHVSSPENVISEPAKVTAVLKILPPEKQLYR